MLVLVLVVHSQWWRRSVKILLDLECRSSGVLEQATLLYSTQLHSLWNRACLFGWRGQFVKCPSSVFRKMQRSVRGLGACFGSWSR